MDDGLDDLLTSSDEHDVIIKCHQPGPRTRAAIFEGTIHNIFTHRDPRDAAASALEVGIVESLDQILAILELHQSTYLAYVDGPTLCIPYQEAVVDDRAGIRRIADYVGHPQSPAQLEALADALGMEQTRARASKLTEEDFEERYPHERETLLHRNHITDGRIGRWRDALTSEQASRIERALAPFFAGFGYAPRENR